MNPEIELFSIRAEDEFVLANLPYAEESIANSRKFISTIKSLIELP